MAFEYVRKDTPLDRMNPIVKLAYMGAALIFALNLSQIPQLSIVVLWLIVATLWWIVGKVELRSLGILLSLLKWMVLFLMIIQGLTYRFGDQTVLLKLFDWPSPDGTVNYGELTAGGVMFGLFVSTRIMVVLSVIPIFTMTTSMSRLNAALAKMRVPQKVIFMFITAMRFVPLVQESWDAIIDAQKIRGFDIDKANFFQKIRRAYIPIITPLILLMFRRAMDMEVAINARAFGAKKERTYIEDISFKRIDYVGFLAVIAIFIGMIYVLYTPPLYTFLWNILVSVVTLVVSLIITISTTLSIDVLLQAFNGILINIPILGLYFGYFNQNVLLGYGGVVGLLLAAYIIYKMIRRYTRTPRAK
ncbi:energy-coupling factor transporter transmembrane protein EcfT, partial [Candidatus Thorarchaeota archaeon]